METGLKSLTRGRFAKRGLTWTSAVLVMVLVVVAMAALGRLLEEAQPVYPITIAAGEERVIGTEPACEWQLDLEIRNDSDRTMRLISVAMPDVDDSEQGMIGNFEPGESITRTYRYGVDSCVEPVADELVVVYGPAMTTKQRSVTLTID
jgi:hypothetical protein